MKYRPRATIELLLTTSSFGTPEWDESITYTEGIAEWDYARRTPSTRQPHAFDADVLSSECLADECPFVCVEKNLRHNR